LGFALFIKRQTATLAASANIMPASETKCVFAVVFAREACIMFIGLFYVSG
jgi:hypothetical protein